MRVTAFSASSASMSSPTRNDRRSPIVCTAKPSRLEPFGQQRNLRRAPRTVRALHHDQAAAQLLRIHAGNRRAVETRTAVRRAPFLPLASSLPGVRSGCPLADVRVRIFVGAFHFFLGANCARSNSLAHDLAHQLLQLVHGHRAVHQHEMIRLHHLVVIVQDALLENAEAFGAVERKSQVHARFVIFQLGPAGHDAVDGHVQRRAKIKGDVGNGREAVQISQPVRRAAARRVARKRRVNVAVREHQIAAVQQAAGFAARSGPQNPPRAAAKTWSASAAGAAFRAASRISPAATNSTP